MKWSPLSHVSYCTNVHPGESLSDLQRIITEEVCAVKALTSPNQPFGTGLRLGAQSVAALTQDPKTLMQLKEVLIRSDMYVFTVNGFPYGDFAAERVKESVYDPDWSTQERGDYTLSIARLMTQLPGPTVRSISTVAGGFQPTPLTPERGLRFGAELGRVARGLYQLEEESGVRVVIALEPEPWTTLERIDQVISFFEEYVWPTESLSQRYIGICYDTCHQAVLFEDPQENWRRLRTANIPIYKVQISNALHLSNPRDHQAYSTLLSFAEPRYLHQVNALTPRGELLRALDLPELHHPSSEWLNAQAWRCHFHVPIWWEGAAGVNTTQAHWRQIAQLITEEEETKQRTSTLHIEVETYSWDVIPSSHRSELGDLRQCVAQEIEALRAELFLRAEPLT